MSSFFSQNRRTDESEENIGKQDLYLHATKNH
jgi:hypothetical protein